MRAFTGAARGDRVMTEAYYRLTDKPDSGAVMVEDILQPHRHRTLRRTQGEKTGLRVKVSSAVNFAKRGKGLGGTNQTGAAARPFPVPHIFVGLALGQKERDAVARLGQTLALCDELIGRGMLGGGIVRRDDIASARLQNAVLWRGEQEPSAGPQAGEFHGMREIPMLLVTISAAQPARGGGGDFETPEASAHPSRLPAGRPRQAAQLRRRPNSASHG